MTVRSSVIAEVNERWVEIFYTYHYSPARFYTKNGDPGYPEEEEITWTVKTLLGERVQETEEDIPLIESAILKDVRR